jgi:hypothetical protein
MCKGWACIWGRQIKWFASLGEGNSLNRPFVKWSVKWTDNELESVLLSHNLTQKSK